MNSIHPRAEAGQPPAVIARVNRGRAGATGGDGRTAEDAGVAWRLVRPSCGSSSSTGASYWACMSGRRLESITMDRSPQPPSRPFPCYRPIHLY
jgi:hypothetical protein